MSPWATFIASVDMACGASHDCRDCPGPRSADPADNSRVSRTSARDRSGRGYGLDRLAHVASPSNRCAESALAKCGPRYLGGWKREFVRRLSSEDLVGTCLSRA